MDDFDADWYRATYSDVALTGLSPREHYEKFGRAMGRAGNAGALAGQGAGRGAAVPVRGIEGPVLLPETAAARFGHGGESAAALPPGVETSPIIPPPPGMPLPRVARPDLSRPPAGQALCLSAGAGEIARFADEADFRRLAAPLAGYLRLLGLAHDPGMVFALTAPGGDAPALAPGLETEPGLGGGAFQSGAARIAEAWFTDEFGLRLRLADLGGAAGIEAAAVRAYQADPAEPGKLQLVGGQVLPGEGAAIFDLALLNPLMPVLLELSGRGGLTEDLGLLPFPSLARGGLHGAERAALQLGPVPMAEIWRLGAALLEELCADAAAPRSVAAIEIDVSGATGAERICSQAVRGWLAAVFGLTVTAAAGVRPGDPGEDYVAGLLGSDGPAPGAAPQAGAGGLTLALPVAAVPTLGVLCSRRLVLPGGQAAAGPFLVADAVSCRGQFSVALPRDGTAADTRQVPVLRPLPGAPGPRAPQEDGPGHWLAPLHLAIRFAAPLPVNDIHRLLPVAPDAPRAAPAGPVPELALALTVSDPALTRRFLASLARQEGVAVTEILLCLPAAVEEAPLCAAAAALFPAARIDTAAGAADPGQATEALSGALILLAEDATILYDPRAAGRLAGMLEADPQAGSAACVLLHEAVQKGRAQIQVAAAGLFPGHVSFLAAPRLGVVEPDALAALPDATYPVLANSFRLCLIRRAAIVATRAARAALPAGASADLKFGLDAFAAGYRSLCTSTVRAGTTAPPARRDEIDPFGLACVLPARWDDLLSSVTVLRELRG